MSFEQPNTAPTPENSNNRIPHVGDHVRVDVVGTVESDWEIKSVDEASERVGVENPKGEVRTLKFEELKKSNRWLFEEHGSWDEVTKTDIKRPEESGEHRIGE